MTDARVAAYLDGVRKRGSSGKYYNPALLRNEDVPRLVAALEAVLALHVQDTTWGAGLKNGRFDYCSTCSGHPAWPCPELQAISRALLGEGEPS